MSWEVGPYVPSVPSATSAQHAQDRRAERRRRQRRVAVALFIISALCAVTTFTAALLGVWATNSTDGHRWGGTAAVFGITAVILLVAGASTIEGT